jgi:poly(3-hydroxyalkanoate) synthetase
MQLIQYEATTHEVLKRPLLIVPPWINKYYILDLNPEKSFVKWALELGQTVFVISWVNPDERLAEKCFEDYMREGIFAALDAIKARPARSPLMRSATVSAARFSLCLSLIWRCSAVLPLV